jgi:hypothetical protein
VRSARSSESCSEYENPLGETPCRFDSGPGHQLSVSLGFKKSQRKAVHESESTCDAAYKQVVLLKCYDALVTAGFTRFRKEGVDWPLENGFHSWVGLNTALFDEYVEINPFVGVHVVPIEKLWTSQKAGGIRGNMTEVMPPMRYTWASWHPMTRLFASAHRWTWMLKPRALHGCTPRAD